ncbi:MAG: hypothetical protein AAF413_00755 [Patescibacteria group bacterium]
MKGMFKVDRKPGRNRLTRSMFNKMEETQWELHDNRIMHRQEVVNSLIPALAGTAIGGVLAFGMARGSLYSGYSFVETVITEQSVEASYPVFSYLTYRGARLFGRMAYEASNIAYMCSLKLQHDDYCN